MDSNVDKTEPSANDAESIIADTQINPLTMMTSAPPFEPVDDSQENVLASIDTNLPPEQSSETPLSFIGDISSPNIFVSSLNIADQKLSSNIHMDNQAIAAWVETTTTELVTGALERSPSLPSTLFEPITTRGRRDSNVSTICDHQQSIISDTLTSQQLSYSNDMQRSLSMPINDQYHRGDDDKDELIQPVNEEEGEDMSTKFLPVPDSEDSEVEKKTKQISSADEEPIKFESRSPTTRENPKKSPNVSFHASVSFEAHTKASTSSHRKRRTSWNANKNKHPSFQRSYSTIATTQQPPSLHSQILRKQFRTALSMPTGTFHSSGDTTRQSSDLSDNVFLSSSNTNSSSYRNHGPFFRDTRFLGIPSSVSGISSDRNMSVISDASGRSGIESTNLDPTPSDQLESLSINDNKLLPLPRQQRNTSTSSTTSATPSTQSLSSSSDDELNSFTKKMKNLQMDKTKGKVSTDPRRDVLKQLMWLLEKKPTIYAKFGLGRRKSASPPKPSQLQKSTPNPFVEFCSSFRSNNACNATLRNEPDVPSKNPSKLYSSSNEPSNILHSLPLSSQVSYIDPMSQSYSSVRSTHSESSATTPLINTKSSSRNLPTTSTSLSSSLHMQRKRGPHRRTPSGFVSVTRDRKNSLNKSDQQNLSQQDQEQKSPLNRNIEAILNEHLTMINNLLPNYLFNASMQYTTPNSSFREFLYTSLNELSQKNPMNQRCSRVETKAFIDLISSFQMNRAHHYSFLIDSVKDSLISNNDPVHFSNRFSETEDDVIKDGHIASNESSNASSPSLTRYTSTESKYEVDDDEVSFNDNPLRFFRTLSEDYLLDCERTENELKKLFDLADQQHILYCLKHVDSGHTNDSLTTFHRRLDALFVWYNLYYELTISVKKLSGLLRCDDCEDWPKLRFRSIGTNRDRIAKRADENDVDYSSTDEESEEEIEEEIKTEDSEIEEEFEAGDDSDILPKNRWPEEPLDHFSRLEISDDSIQNETNPRIRKLYRKDCYRNFVYYMDKRSYQVKYDGLARTLIERVAPVLVKTRLALLQSVDRHKIKIERVLAGLSLGDYQSSNINNSKLKNNLKNDETEDKLVDTDNPVDEDVTVNINIGELTIEKWLFHVLKSCSTIKTICSHTEDILKNNWLELHQELGLPSLLPLYLFIINVLLDVMNECLILYNKPHMNNDTIEKIDSLCRQQLVREAKLVLRDALATRLYSVRMMEQFISHRKILSELMEFDENTLKLYTHYKRFLSAVCINRTFGTPDDENMIMDDEAVTDLYYYVDEETSELIKEYYFARDLTVTLGNRTEIRDLCIDFSTLTQRILAQLKEELNDKTEQYYQAFAIDMNDTSNIPDTTYSADITCETMRPPYFHTSNSAPFDLSYGELPVCDTAASFSDQKKNDIISSTREFRRHFDIIKQRATRACHLAKTLIEDFSIAAEFKCVNHTHLWQELHRYKYAQVKIYLNTRDTDDFDNFYVFVPPWLSTDKDQVDKLLSIICNQQISSDEINKTNKDTSPFYMVFLPTKNFHRQNIHWTGEILVITPSESTKLALNSTELPALHLVVNRSDQWQNAVDLFQSHVGLTNIQLIRRVPRDEDIRLTFDQLPEHIEKLSIKLTDLVRTLNTIWDQDSTKIYLTEIVKFDERTIESKLVDLVLYVYNSGFDLFRLLYELIPTISPNNDEIFEKFVSTMNEFFCEWCKCVTKKFKYTPIQQARTAKFKVLRPRWLSPGMVFLRFLAKSTHLQLLSDEDYKKLSTEMPAALTALYGNVKSNHNSPTTKVRSNSVSSTSTQLGRTRGHRRVESGGRYNELLSSTLITPQARIAQKIKNLENGLEKKFRERKQIGKIFANTTTTSGSTPDPVISLKMRNIDFPWRRGTRIGQGGAGVAFRAINCSNGSIVCMKEIQLSSIASRSLPNAYPAKLRLIAEEIDMIMSINHPNIVRYFGIEKYKRTIYICMEYCLSTVNEFLNDIRAFQKRAHIKRKNSVFWSDSSEPDEDINTNDRIRLNSSLDINENVRGFVQQLLQALLALHELNIVHCDVKGDNIFIANENGQYIVKLGDFNLSHRLELESSGGSDSRSTQKGTIYFKPPEPQYVCKSDIWALGCTIIEMLTGKLPWTNVTRPPEDQIYIQNQLLAKKGPPIPDDLKNQTEAYEFIQLCLKPDLEERRSGRELVNHPYPRVIINVCIQTNNNY